MDTRVKERLQKANKLIFVKMYDVAERVIEEILSSPAGKDDLVVHLRRIELATMLGKLPALREAYLEDIRRGRALPVSEVCLAIVEQHGEMVPGAEIVARFQEFIKNNGPSAAAYYGIGFAMEQLNNLDRAAYNYEQSLKVDPEWFPAFFGLSQVSYQKGDDQRGDRYFYQFEQAAPYNVYGNFETHRKLSQEFFEQENYEAAEAAIQALSTWWVDNKGNCPPEIQIYENLALARISDGQGDAVLSESRRGRATVLAREVIEEKSSEEGILYFVAKILEEFGEHQLALEYYRSILRRSGKNAALVQKIGGQFLSLGEYKLAKELFADAYEANPDSPEIRFCLLVARLKEAGVNVEDYLIGRERLRSLVDNPAERVELLALLHSLMAKFQGDPEVQGHVADVYLRLGNISRAETHYKKMRELDPRSRTTALKYAAFLMQYGDPDVAIGILEGIKLDESAKAESQTELYWLKSNYYSRKGDYRKSLELLRMALAADPWNVSYLIQEAINLAYLMKPGEEPVIDDAIHHLNAGKEADVNWEEFNRRTVAIEAEHGYELAYVRRKLHFLYANGKTETLRELVRAASKYSSERGTYEIVRLLNTNFDSAHLYWALGILFKDLWQLETAAMWLEQALLYPAIDDATKRKCYLELADTYIWRNIKLPKAIEYAKLAMDMGERSGGRALTVLAHGFLRSGQIRQAQVYLEQSENDRDIEATYLLGLLHYRNGAPQKAKQVWKPLLTVRTESLRFHNIKQEILRYYFEGTPYLKAN